MGLPTVLVSLLAISAFYAFYRAAKFLYNESTAPRNALRGPPNPSLIFGNMYLLDESVCLSITTRKLIYSDFCRHIRICKKSGSRNMGTLLYFKPYFQSVYPLVSSLCENYLMGSR